MDHICDTHLAVKYGLNQAIFIRHIAYWVLTNKANNKHLFEGKHWMYSTQHAFSVLFPFWSRQNIRTVIKNCLDNGLLLKGNFNKVGYDKTTWYTLSDRALELFVNKTLGYSQPIEWLESTNRLVRTNQPIPNNKINIKNKKNNIKKIKKTSSPKPDNQLPSWLPKELWEEFVQHRKLIKSPMSELAQKKALTQLGKMREAGQDIEAVINRSIINGWKGLFEIKHAQGDAHGKAAKGNDSYGSRADWNKESFDVLADLAGFEGKDSNAGNSGSENVVSSEDDLHQQVCKNLSR